MAPFSAILFAATTACASVVARNREDSSSIKAAPPSLPVYQDVRTHPISKLKRRKDDDNNAPIYNMTSTSYLIELSIGSPGQKVKVALDTGSSELWLNPNCENAGNNDQEAICDDHGHYSPSSSTTSQESQTRNTISYGKGEVLVQYVADDISMPGTSIDIASVIFGYALDSTDLATGIMGLSFGENVNMQYPSVVDELYQQNLTETRAFGVALGSKTEKTGSGVISFGGVDTKKFTGDLLTMPILGPQNGEQLARYWVQLDSIGITHGDGDSSTYDNSSFPVFFDTGATLSYLPSGVIRDMAKDLGGKYDASVALYVVPCGQDGSVDFTFGGKQFRVPMSEFIWEVGSDTCVLGADVEGDGSYILGDSFLRSIYTVFDLDTPALHFAPYVNCGSNLKMITAGANATREFSGECSASLLKCSNVRCDGGESSSSGGTPNSDDSGAGSLAPPGSAWLGVLGVVGAQALLAL